MAQYETESEATIPLDKFYIARKGGGRKLLSRLTFGLSTGFGSTTFLHKLEGFGILQNPGEAVRIYNSGDETSGYTNWFNKIEPATNTLMADRFSIDSDNPDNNEIGFKAKAWSIPIKATLHYEFLERYRIGGGYSIEYMNIGTFKPISYGDRISGFSPAESSFFLKKYFGMIGGSVYRYYDYLLVVDLNIGGYKLGQDFVGDIKRGVFINLGVAAEREMSEYFRLFVRPSYEFKAYTIAVPEAGGSIRHRFNAFYVNIGATYRFPELRRCPIKGCHGQLNHAHGNREYRSRRHPMWKKQNPHYGENYPTLIKYKGKNKKKINPY